MFRSQLIHTLISPHLGERKEIIWIKQKNKECSNNQKDYSEKSASDSTSVSLTKINFTGYFQMQFINCTQISKLKMKKTLSWSRCPTGDWNFHGNWSQQTFSKCFFAAFVSTDPWLNNQFGILPVTSIFKCIIKCLIRQTCTPLRGFAFCYPFSNIPVRSPVKISVNQKGIT